MNFVLAVTLLKSFFRDSTMAPIALSSEADGYKLATSYDTWISIGDVFHVLPSLINFWQTSLTEFLSLVLLDYFSQILKNSIEWGFNWWYNSTHGMFFSGLWAFKVFHITVVESDLKNIFQNIPYLWISFPFLIYINISRFYRCIFGMDLHL